MCMHKFEKVTRFKEGARIFNAEGDLNQPGTGDESLQIDDDQLEECIRLTVLNQVDAKLTKFKMAIYKAALPSHMNKIQADCVSYCEK